MPALALLDAALVYATLVVDVSLMTVPVLLAANRPGHGGLRVLAAGGYFGGGVESRQHQLDPRKDHEVGFGVLVSVGGTAWAAGAGADAGVLLLLACLSTLVPL